MITERKRAYRTRAESILADWDRYISRIETVLAHADEYRAIYGPGAVDPEKSRADLQKAKAARAAAAAMMYGRDDSPAIC